MADQSKRGRRAGSWRGRLTVLGLFLLGLIAIAVLRVASVRVAPRSSTPVAEPDLPESRGH